MARLCSVGAVVFDVEGTLVDTGGCWSRALESILGPSGLSLSTNLRGQLVGASIGETCAALRTVMRPEGSGRDLESRLERAVVAELRHLGCEPIAGARELVSQVANRYKVAVASGSPSSIVNTILSLSGLDDLVTVRVTADDVRRTKPYADVYLRACERLGVEPCLVVAVEDSVQGVISAYNAGLTVVQIGSSARMDGAAYRFADLRSIGLRSLLGVAET